MATNTDIIRNLYERLEQRDIEGVLSSFADDCEIEFVGPSDAIPFAGKYHGRLGMQEALGKLTETADVIDMGPDEIHEDGEFVAVLGHEHARCKETGREWKTPLSEAFVVRDGKIRRFTCMYDTARVAMAYGTKLS